MRRWDVIERGAHLERGARRAQGVVLVGHRDPEDGHHGVADVLLHHPAVAPDRRVGALEPAPNHLMQRLGVQSLAELREPGDVGEEDGDDLARPGGRGDEIGKGRAAERAIPGPRATRPAAIGARRHAESLCPVP